MPTSFRWASFACACFLALVPTALTGQAGGLPQATLGARERNAVIDSLGAQLRRYYVRPAVAESLIAILDRRRAEGAFDGADTPSLLTARLDAEVRKAIRDDAHLAIRYTPAPVQTPSSQLSPADAAAQRRAERAAFIQDAHDESFGIPEVRTLDGNVGYMRFGPFIYQVMMGVEPFSRPALAAAMQLVAERDALILDLRDNRGSHTSVVPFVLGYVLDSLTAVGSSRTRDGQVTKDASLATVPGPRFGGVKPLYVLTSDSTFSGGEAIALALQENKRAIVVGARTRGGTRSGDFHPIGAGIVAFIPDTENFDAAGKSRESVGVAPDVPAAPRNALDVAYGLALESLAKATVDPTRRFRLDSLARVVRQKRPA